MKNFGKIVIGLFIALQALTASAQEIVPRHIQLGRDLVQNVKPENNEYVINNRTVQFPGDRDSSQYAASTDCIGFVETLLTRTYSFRPAFSTQKFKTRFSLIDYVDGIERGESGFTPITKVSDLRVGDVIAWKFINKQASVRANGHIMFVNGTPQKVPMLSLSGSTKWAVSVLDSSASPKGPEDTRLTARDTPQADDDTEGEKKGGKRMGVGIGQVHLYADSDGNLTGLSYGFHNSKVYWHGDRNYYVMGRLSEKNR